MRRLVHYASPLPRSFPTLGQGMGVSPLFAPLSTLSSFIAFSASRIAPPRMPGVRKKRDRAEDPDRQERKKQRLLAQEGSVSCRTRSSMAKLNPTVTTRTIAGVQYTYINGSEQSAMHTDSLRSYDYLAIITQCLTQTDAQGMTVLLLGVAGGVLCRQWEAYFPEAIQQVDAVDINPEVIQRCQEQQQQGSLFRTTNFVLADACQYVRGAAKRRYDAVVEDVFAGPHKPPGVNSTAFLEAVRACLKPGGCYVSNIHKTMPGMADTVRANMAAAGFTGLRAHKRDINIILHGVVPP